MFHAVYQTVKVYLRTLDIEHRIYRRKRNLLNLPYSPIITICSLSTVIVKYGPMVIVHVICFIMFFSSFFFLVCFFISIKFQFL